jgi:predicted nucleic acid-binding protein
MKKILMDSGPMIALFDASDRYHQAALDFIRSNRTPLVTTLASVTETLHMLDFSRQAQLDFLEWIHRGAVEIQHIDNSDFGRIRELTEKYQDLPMDFADSCLVHLAEQLGIDRVATIDRDFSIYRINGRKKFKVVLS